MEFSVLNKHNLRKGMKSIYIVAPGDTRAALIEGADGFLYSVHSPNEVQSHTIQFQPKSPQRYLRRTNALTSTRISFALILFRQSVRYLDILYGNSTSQ